MIKELSLPLSSSLRPKCIGPTIWLAVGQWQVCTPLFIIMNLQVYKTTDCLMPNPFLLFQQATSYSN